MKREGIYDHEEAFSNWVYDLSIDCKNDTPVKFRLASSQPNFTNQLFNSFRNYPPSYKTGQSTQSDIIPTTDKTCID